MANLRMDPKFAQRNVNEGFSGGEKKRHEILQLELLQPKIAVLDETDSGLDVDALKVVSEGVNRAKSSSDLGVLLITHYRSEEHTSELQSLMRISYAVFCLKQKKK